MILAHFAGSGGVCGRASRRREGGGELHRWRLCSLQGSFNTSTIIISSNTLMYPSSLLLTTITILLFNTKHFFSLASSPSSQGPKSRHSFVPGSTCVAVDAVFKIYLSKMRRFDPLRVRRRTVMAEGQCEGSRRGVGWCGAMALRSLSLLAGLSYGDEAPTPSDTYCLIQLYILIAPRHLYAY